MTIKEIAAKIKAVLESEQEEITVDLVDVKTKDDVILSFETMEVGQEIFVVDPEGRTPAEDGEYILEDGTKLIVQENKIAEIVASEEPAEPEVPVDEVVMAKLSDVEPLIEKIEKLEKDYTDMKTILEELAGSVSEKELKEDIKTEMKKVQPKVEKKDVKMSKKYTGLEKTLKDIYDFQSVKK